MKGLRVQTLILLLISLDLPGGNAHGQKPPDVARKVTVATVQSKDVTITHQYTCRINSHQRVEVRAPAGGHLEAIPVGEGQAVKRDDLLFRVVPRMDKKKSDTEKQNTVIPIKAPFDGMVGRLLHHEGSSISKGDTLTTLSDNSEMWVYFNVPEVRYLEYMAEQKQNHQVQDVELLLADQSKFPQTGKLGAIGAKFNNETGNIAFRADFPNPDGRLRHGQTGTVLINRVLKDAIVVPRRATFENLHKRYVYVVDKNNVAHLREIVIQNASEDLFVIKKGVEVGDQIVLEGVELVRDGEKVK